MKRWPVMYDSLSTIVRKAPVLCHRIRSTILPWRCSLLQFPKIVWVIGCVFFFRWAFFIVYAQVYVGVHYPLDVICGAFRTTMLDKQTTQIITAEVLKALNLQPNQADELQKIPVAQITDAGKKSLKGIADQMKAAGKTLPPCGLNWGPSLDGEYLPYQLFSKEAFDLSKNIRLMIGTVKNKFMPSLFANLTNAPPAKILDYIKNQQGNKADTYIAAVQKAYPDDTKPSDLIDVDAMFRPGSVSQANEKSSLTSGTSVYMYLFDWQSTVMDGKYKAVHCMEPAFAFNNINRFEERSGGTKQAYALADKVSSAWINFARNGNPNHKGLSNWPAYNITNTATMHFNNKCTVKPQLDKDLFELTAPRLNFILCIFTFACS